MFYSKEVCVEELFDQQLEAILWFQDSNSLQGTAATGQLLGEVRVKKREKRDALGFREVCTFCLFIFVEVGVNIPIPMTHPWDWYIFT